MGFWIKIFKKLSYSYCSFITTVRFLETLQTDYSEACENIRFSLLFAAERRNGCFRRLTTPLSWIKTEVLFLYMFHWFLFIFLFITCHSRILQCVEFKNFCSFAVCGSFSTTPNRNTADYRLNEVCFPSFVYRFIILAEKVSSSKIWKSSPLF